MMGGQDCQDHYASVAESATRLDALTRGDLLRGLRKT